jgi:hypothetical protein
VGWRVAAAAALLAAPAGLSAQGGLVYLPLDSSSVIRLHLTGGRRVTGRLLAPFGPDSTRFVWCAGVRGPCGADARSGARVTPAADVTRVETRRGHRAARGAVVGAIAAAVGAAAVCAATDVGGCDPAKGGFFSYVLLPTALAGAGVGAIVGAGISVWERAP